MDQQELLKERVKVLESAIIDYKYVIKLLKEVINYQGILLKPTVSISTDHNLQNWDSSTISYMDQK